MAATTIATMAMLNAKCLSINNNNSPKTAIPSAKTTTTTTKPMPLLSMQNLPKGLTINSSSSSSLAGTAIAGAIFSALSSCEPAMAAQQIAEIAEGSDNRGTLLLFVITPAIAWVLFNILQPALNQLNKMRNTKSVIVGLGLGGLATASTGFISTPFAESAIMTHDQIAMIGDATSSDNRGTLLLFVVAPAIAWVLYNILQPALNQINRMRSD